MCIETLQVLFVQFYPLEKYKQDLKAFTCQVKFAWPFLESIAFLLLIPLEGLPQHGKWVEYLGL